ncbi:MAG: octaprenyl-diphosphate synthase [Kiritimatiellia bacterium]|jgi:geranylgeranyl pyrophosphate synthase
MDAEKVVEADTIEEKLGDVRELVKGTLIETSLGFLVHDHESLIASGKLLRSRLGFRIAEQLGADHRQMVHGAAAVEMIHTASLLHDDVIDGGMIRRGAPTFWVEKGAAGAILLGDLFLFKAVDLVCQVDGTLAHELVKLTGEVCEAESEQELVLQGAESTLEICMSIARRKTGALFAFMAYCAASDDEALRVALKEAGYLVGTAYQMADDLLDVSGDAEAAGKTLGTDRHRDIVSSAEIADPVRHLEELCTRALTLLEPWPAARDGMVNYLEQDLRPAMDKLLACVSR